MNHTTALVSCFARAFHFQNNQTHIFSDPAAYPLLKDDYARIAQHMTEGISYFLPGFTGSPEEGLRKIVDGQLSPSVLGRKYQLKTAADFLHHSNFSVSQISNEVGFPDPNYCSKCFKKEYHMTPTQYRNSTGQSSGGLRSFF